MLSKEDKYYLKEAMPFIGAFIVVNTILISVMFPEFNDSVAMKIVGLIGINITIVGILRMLAD